MIQCTRVSITNSVAFKISGLVINIFDLGIYAGGLPGLNRNDTLQKEDPVPFCSSPV